MKTSYAIVGLKHWHAEALVRSLSVDELLDLIREPDNSHDKNAIQVWARGQQVGYIGRGQKTPSEEDRAAGRKYIPGHENEPLARFIDERGVSKVSGKLIAGWPPRVMVEE